MYTKVSTAKMSREEWRKLRKTGIGGSDAGAVCGLNPYSSPIKVYRDKTSDGIDEEEDNESIRQGNDLEDYVAQRFMEATGLKVRRSNYMYRSNAYPFMIADVDRIVVGEDAGLECKTVSAYNSDKWKDGDIPLHYIMQCYNLLKELKQSHHFEDEHRRALTVAEQELFLDFLADERSQYHHWHPIFTVMIGTGMRVGEICGLRWDDIDLDEGIIDVNHTLVYYNHRDENGCYFNVHTPKTKAGNRQIPMTEEVKAAFLAEKYCQELNNLRCNVMVDGYTNFIFINRFGNVQHQGTMNKAIRRIIRDCNDKQLLKGRKNPVLLPNFSCHSLRHTFTTRLVEAGVNIKVIQELCGHTRSDVTLDIYTTVTKELKLREFGNFEEKLKQQKQEWKQKANKDAEEE